MISLLDVNVLIALIDPNNPRHQAATAFFKNALKTGWATCPLTENALLRIVGSPAYPGGPGSVEETRKQFAKYLAAPGHQFWPDEISLIDRRLFPALPPAKALTDIYLLALAIKRQGQFATFDGKIDPSAIPGGPAALHVLG